MTDDRRPMTAIGRHGTPDRAAEQPLHLSFILRYGSLFH